MNESCRTYIWVTSHILMSHVAQMNESRRTYEWVTLHTWMSHVAHMNESRRTYAWVTFTYTNESCHTCKRVMPQACEYAQIRIFVYEWDTSHTWKSHVTHINDSCHRCVDLPKSGFSFVIPPQLETNIIRARLYNLDQHTCDMTYSYGWHDKWIWICEKKSRPCHFWACQF